ncbi:MAG: transglycosylase domain-containing protein, partial [Actinomycetota bacterium]
DIYAANESTSAEIDLNELALRSIVYDMHGDEFDVLYDVENRELVDLDDISHAMIMSLIVVEDEGFYDHNGVDAKAIGRAFIENVNAGGIEQGGSTITQQLIKNGVLSNEQQLDRKIPEAALAIRLEDQLTKDEILEAYLNTVYFGSGAYGVRAAAEIYFGVSPDRLTWPQGALLASLISNPDRYDPTRFPDIADERRTVALVRLLETGHIDQEQYDRYVRAPLPTERRVAAEWEPTNYFIEEVRRQLLDDPRLGATFDERAERLFGGGLRVFTTYDPAAQSAAEAAVEAHIPDDERGFYASLASVEPGTGRVRAIVGGPGFDVFEFNIATQKGRPTGSSFKPFVLASAFEKGFVPADQINGIGTCEFANPGGFPNPYRANNFSGPGSGSVASLRSQTLASSNCAYVRLGVIVGLSNVADTSRALGITSDLSDLPISMPLGPKDVTPMDMATGYATFANDGLQVDPIFIERVEDRDGNVIFENTPDPERAISVQSARLVNQVLEANVRGGTGTRARLEDQVAAGKTGTAQDFSDAWFVGYTPHLATAVWMGNPDEQIPMRDVDRGVMGRGNVFGGSLPAMIWGAFNTAYHENLPPVAFEAPEGTRGGIRIRTDQEEDDYLEVIESFCGTEDDEAAVDTDEDGIVDYCDPEKTDFEFDKGIAECPILFEPVDANNDGKIDGCAAPTTTTTTTTSTTTLPPTTTTGGSATTTTTTTPSTTTTTTTSTTTSPTTTTTTTTQPPP